MVYITISRYLSFGSCSVSSKRRIISGTSRQLTVLNYELFLYDNRVVFCTELIY